MRYAIDPRQMTLFDPATSMFSPMTLKFLSSDWPGLFRRQMLHLMPADALGKHFSQLLGFPTKELYGMAGAILLKEFFNLTISQTVERYLTDAAWQYALNVNPMEASLSHATVERYLKLFADDQNVRGRSSYQAMERVLREQCDVAEQTVQLKKKTGGEVMQNPFDDR